MAYNKKNWQDNVSDITAAELNRIEQGIYDNSLVVDAVTNKLNPTDTETYKTAELTEGQITDVIGVNDILIKGQTSQDGEPTPSSPVDVNVVSGSNIIRTNNKNLLPNNAQSITQNGVTFTINKNKSIKINGTASANTDIYLFGGTTDTGNYLHFSKGTYSLSTASSNFYYIAREKTKGALVGNSAILQALSSDDCYFYGFFIRVNNGATFNNLVIYPQLEKNSTATAYETHQGKELPLDLGKNLFNKDNYLANTGINSDGTIATSNNNSLFYIPIKYGKKYTISFVDNGVSGNILYGFSNDKPVLNGTCTYNALDITTLNNHTFTPVNVNNKYLCIRLNVVNTNQYQAMENIQVELGSEATKYVPYDPDPIELCKIGNYQDYFYKSGSRWYLHKEIEKKVLNGSEEWALRSGGRFSVDIPSADGDFFSTGLSNQYKFIANWDTHIATNYSFTVRNGTWGVNKARISLINTDYEDVTQFKADLATNNLIVYYQRISQLGGATNTEITDTTLISQLEAIYNAPLYEQTNITQTNNDLPMVLDIIACKDNINGIKAFIRK